MFVAVLAAALVHSVGWALCCGLCGCEPVRELVLTPVLPTPCVSQTVNELRVRGLGDFPALAGQTASLSQGGAENGTALELPRGTRVVSVEGLVSGGVIAFGRTAPSDLPAVWEEGGEGHRVPIAYGAPDSFCTTAALAYTRREHHATLLSDGSVLLSGGVDSGGLPVTALERYLPNGDDTHPLAVFLPVGVAGGAATVDRGSVLGHSATLLSDGRIFLAGGAPSTNGDADGIAYAGALTLAADGRVLQAAHVLEGGARAFHAATLLPDGRVLLTGGCAKLTDGVCDAAQTLASAVLYDATSDTYATTFPLVTPRSGHRALVRDDGLVLIVGGRGQDGLASPPELYDPVEARGNTIGGPTGTAVLLPSGLVVALNDAGGPSARMLAWSGRDEAPALLPQLPSERSAATLTALEDGAVLIAGGGDGTTLAPMNAVLTTDGPTLTLGGFAARGHTATLLLDGSVLLAGGADVSGRASASASLFLRSLVGPFHSPATIAFDGALSLVPSRPGVSAIVEGALVIDGGVANARAPSAYSMLAGPAWAGPAGAGFDLSVLVGTDGDAEAVILFGDPGRARYVAITLAVGAAPQLLSVTRDRPGLLRTEALVGCDAIPVAAVELPDQGLAPLTVHARNGAIELTTADAAGAGRRLLRCPVDGRVPLRGAIALGALHGRVRWDNVQAER